MDYFLIAYGALLLALSFFFGKYGSLWIDRLYLKNHSILSFPGGVSRQWAGGQADAAVFPDRHQTLLRFTGNYFSFVTCTLRIAAFDHCNRF